MKRIALYPGTFDPVTNGHLDIIYRASSLCDVLIIGVAENIGKNPFFNIFQRKSLIEEAVNTSVIKSKRKLGKIKVKSFDNLLIDFARSNSVTMIIRGLRAVSDFEYEFQMTGMNYQLSPEIETIFLMSADNNSFISSNLVKEVHGLGGDVSKFVSDNTIKILNNKNSSS